MLDVHELTDRIHDLFTGKNRMTAILSSVLIAMTFCACIILIIQVNNRSHQKTAAQPEQQLSADQPLLVPDSPAVPRGYFYSRNKNGQWNDDDAHQWFTVPEKNAIDELGAANDRTISDITGAAP